MTRRREIMALSLLVAIVACAGEADHSRTPVVERTCGTPDSRTLTGQGIGDFRVGATVDEIRAKCAVVRDTALEHGTEGMPERRIAARIGQDTVEGMVNDGRMWRIEVRSPRFRTDDSLGVGSTIATLRQQPMQYLGYGEGGPFVRVARHCGLSFRLTGVPGVAKSWDRVPPTATVDEVLVVGCDTNLPANRPSDP